MNSEEGDDGICKIVAEVPLNNMFGYSTDLRSSTQGKGEFTMEYKRHSQVLPDTQNAMMEEYQKARRAPVEK